MRFSASRLLRASFSCVALIMAGHASAQLHGSSEEDYEPSVYRQKRFKAFSEAASEWHRKESECKMLDGSVQSVRARFDDAQGEALRQLPGLQAELARRVEEKRVSMDEFRRGLRCSRCRRTQTELGGPERFREHLGDVKGDPLPPTEREIAEKEQEFDRAIAQVQSKITALTQAVSKRQGELDDLLSRRQSACEAAGLARTAALQLKAAEERDEEGNGSAEESPYKCEAFPSELQMQLVKVDTQVTALRTNATADRQSAATARIEAAKVRQQLTSNAWVVDHRKRAT